MSPSGTLSVSPLTQNITNVSPDLSNPRKRCRQHKESEAAAGKPFCLFPKTSSPLGSAQPLLVRPVYLIARSRLPLAFLSPASDSDLAGRLFSSKLFLSCKNKYGSGPFIEDAVLIAAVDHHPGLYAVENVQDDIYSLTQMGKEVSVSALETLPVSRWIQHDSSKGPHLDSAAPAQDWWSALSWAAPIHFKKPFLGEAAAVKSMPLIEFAQPEHSTTPTEIALDAPVQLAEQDTSSEPPDVALHNLVIHYLDFLYVSKASHAYFAKAPLARARTAFQEAQDPAGLIQALRNMISTSSCLNKKYKDTVPNVVKAASILMPSHEVSKGRKTPKPPKLKKPRLNKEGLYSLDEDYILRWWANEQLIAVPNPSSLLMQASQQLRVRETLLQIILILEVMSLEKLSERNIHSHKEPLAIDEQPSDAKKVSRKKPQDLNLLLEVHLDSLCIYQSLQDLNLKESDTIQKSIEEDAHASGEDANVDNPKGIRDELKDFCTAVAVPFYGARLPKIVMMLGQKAGTQVSGRASSHGTDLNGYRRLQQPVPGSEIKRRRPKQPLEPLQRLHAAQASKLSKSRPAPLSQAAPGSLEHTSERPRSSTPQASSLFGDVRRSLSRANSVTQSARGRTREVDMGAIHKFNESRQKKNMAVEHELKAAIATLKRPNRSMAVKDYVDAADKRQAAQTAPKSAANKPTSGVQIGATPTRPSKRTSGSLATLSQEEANRPFLAPGTMSRSLPAVPSSVNRRNSIVQLPKGPGQRSVSPLHARNNVVHEERGHDEKGGLAHQPVFKVSGKGTESHSFSKSLPGPFQTLSTSPLVAYKGSRHHVDVTATPTKPRAPLASQAAPKITEVAATPTKPNLHRPVVASTLETPSATIPHDSQSFYATLGWDEDDIDDLA